MEKIADLRYWTFRGSEVLRLQSLAGELMNPFRITDYPVDQRENHKTYDIYHDMLKNHGFLLEKKEYDDNRDGIKYKLLCLRFPMENEDVLNISIGQRVDQYPVCLVIKQGERLMRYRIFLHQIRCLNNGQLIEDGHFVDDLRDFGISVNEILHKGRQRIINSF